MWKLFMLALASADQVVVEDTRGAVEVGPDGETGWVGYILLQTQQFMRRHGFGKDEAHAGECPGKLVEENAQQGKCSYTGVELLVGDGTSITDFFDDNVQMKDFHWYINGIKNVWVNLETHPFRVGSTLVTVEGRDLAGNTRSCSRTVTVKDTQKPKWTVDVQSVDREVTMYVDGSCTRTATSIFAEYESLGWVASGTDNCEVEGVTKQVRKDGNVVYDDSGEDMDDLLKGPGVYEIVYTLTDVSGLTVKHVVAVNLLDNMPPTKIAGCVGKDQPDIFVEVEPHATTSSVTWSRPYVVEDNCLDYGELPTAKEVNGVGEGGASNKTAGSATLAVGEHALSYPVEDASGNRYKEECKFSIPIVPKAHKVNLTCPEDVVARTFVSAPFGAPKWDPPVAMQGTEKLPESQITYLHGAGPERPFPYGTTTVTVAAKGLITGKRTNEEGQKDECTFTVTVKDPERPYVDGRMFRCGADSAGVEPYGVCDGTDLRVSQHPGYEDTGGYDLVEALTLANKACCNDEHGKAYTCQAGASPLFKYCQPAATTV